MKKKLMCLSCGYEKELLDTDPLDKECPICGSNKLQAQLSDETDDKVAEYLEEKESQDEQEKITKEIIQSIGEVGNDKTWGTIENIGDYKLRLKLRILFLKLGGRIAKREETGEKEN